MNWKAKAFAFVFVVAALSGDVTASRGADSPDPARFTYARLYRGSDGNSHFENVTVDLNKTEFAPPAPPIFIGSDFAASKTFFGGFDATWGTHDLEKRLNHPTPASSSASCCKACFPSPSPTARRDGCPPAACFTWRTPHPARATSPSWAIRPNS